MIARTILWSALLLIAVRLFWPSRWRELGRTVNRVVNATLIAIAIVYSGWLLLWFLKG